MACSTPSLRTPLYACLASKPEETTAERILAEDLSLGIVGADAKAAQRLLDANKLTGEARRHKEEAAARLEEYRAASAAASPTKTKSFTDERTEWDQRLAKLGY